LWISLKNYQPQKSLKNLNTYTKYFVYKLFGPMLLITASITGVAWISQALKFVDYIVNRGLEFSTFLYLSSLIIPSLLWVIIPVAMFISITYCYNKIAVESELVILKSSGFTNLDIMRPALIFCCFWVFVSYVVALYLLPASYREFKDMQSYIRNNYASLLLQEGVFSTPIKDLTVYIKSRDEDNFYHGLVVNDARKPEKIITLTAQKGQLIRTEQGPAFLLFNGTNQEKTTSTSKISILNFDQYNLQLKLFDSSVMQKRSREVEERYLPELLFPEENANIALNKLYTEVNNRITWPLYNLLFCFIALIPFVKSDFNRRGYMKKVLLSTFACLCVLFISLMLRNLGQKNLYFSFAMYFITIFGNIGLYVYLTNKTLWHGKTITDYIPKGTTIQ
jgi:lipopolysaccharide export system permease protein